MLLCFICGTMVSIRSVGVGEYQSEDSFVCFGAKPTQRTCARDFQQDRKKTRKGKLPEKSKIGASERKLLEWGVGTCGPINQVNQCENMGQRSC